MSLQGMVRLHGARRGTRLQAQLGRLIPSGHAARVLAVASLIDATGSGLFLAGSALFFTRAVGLTVAQVGLGLSVAGLAGFAFPLPPGALAGPGGRRRMPVALYLVRAAGFCAYVLVSSFAGFLVLVSL